MNKKDFIVRTDFQVRGDQKQAIDHLVRSLGKNNKHQILLGVTGSGKTFTMAKTIEAINRPALILAHNKTLAGQLYTEFRELFPENGVHFFISYYDYYQPEAYVPSSDTYIEKDSSVNDAIDRMRHDATRALLERRDVIIIASVSCIYGIGEPESYTNMRIPLSIGQKIDRDQLIRNLIEIQYERNDYDLYRGSFRVRGDVIEIFPAHEQELLIRVELFGDEVESLSMVERIHGRVLRKENYMSIYPSSHYVVDMMQRKSAIETIKQELGERLNQLQKENKLLEYQRLQQRSLYDLDALENFGFCNGIENYSRHLTGRAPGEPPPTLLDYIPDDFVLFIDESHQTLPQVRGMYNGDRSRKLTLVEHGFRLPSALDNRPLNYEEFEAHINQVVYVSATPGDYEFEKSGNNITELIIRPTGLLDPQLIVKPVEGQIEDLVGEINRRIAKQQRVLVTTLTKRLAEDLSEYFTELDLKVQYLHSDIDTLERASILESLRRGEYDVLIGINLLREGLDLPEVSLVAILDADKEGFLRSKRSLVQTIGRAARHVEGTVILYADRITDSMRGAIEETERRRKIQDAYNQKHGITPESIIKAIRILKVDEEKESAEQSLDLDIEPEALEQLISALRDEMLAAAKALEFERAARLRDRIAQLEDKKMFSETRQRFTKKSKGPKKTNSRARTSKKVKSRKVTL